MSYKIQQSVQHGDGQYAEYIHEDELLATNSSEEPETTALQNQLAIAYNNLLSAQYQLENLTNNVVPVEQRLKFIADFLSGAINILDSVRKEI